MSNTNNDIQMQNGASLFVEWLIQRQIHLVFLVPGKQIAPLLEILATTDHIQTIIANHELAAAYMADGCARYTKKPAVCISIGGPGASNMLTAAVTARMDNSRVFFITGNVSHDVQGIGAFQDGSSNACRDNQLFNEAVHHTDVVTKTDELIIKLRAIQLRTMQQTDSSTCQNLKVEASEIGLLETIGTTCGTGKAGDSTTVSISNNHNVSFTVSEGLSSFSFSAMGRPVGCAAISPCEITLTVTGESSLAIRINSEGYVYAI